MGDWRTQGVLLRDAVAGICSVYDKPLNRFVESMDKVELVVGSDYMVVPASVDDTDRTIYERIRARLIDRYGRSSPADNRS